MSATKTMEALQASPTFTGKLIGCVQHDCDECKKLRTQNQALVEALEKLQRHDFEMRSKTGDGFAPYVVRIIDNALTAAKQAQPEPYGYHSPKTGKVYASTEAASMAMAGEVKAVYLAQQAQPERAPLAPDVVRTLWLQTLEATKGPLPIEEFAAVLAKHYGIKQGGQR